MTQYASKLQVVEGNDVWHTARVFLPNGDPLQVADCATSGTIIAVDIARITSAAGNGGGEVRRILDMTDAAQRANYVKDAYEFDYWDGYDDIGYNFVVRVNSSGTDTAGNAYTFEGGNRYEVSFTVETASFGTIRWGALVDVTGLRD